MTITRMRNNRYSRKLLLRSKLHHSDQFYSKYTRNSIIHHNCNLQAITVFTNNTMDASFVLCFINAILLCNKTENSCTQCGYWTVTHKHYYRILTWKNTYHMTVHLKLKHRWSYVIMLRNVDLDIKL